MTWQSKQRNEEWPISKHEIKLALQRKRRAAKRRIDYYVSEEAGVVIDSLTNHKHTSGVYSRVIDRLILSAASGIFLPIKKERNAN
jgi:non-canonical (house-cleaning) NTP pyrophosphatase